MAQKVDHLNNEHREVLNLKARLIQYSSNIGKSSPVLSFISGPVFEFHLEGKFYLYDSYPETQLITKIRDLWIGKYQIKWGSTNLKVTLKCTVKYYLNINESEKALWRLRNMFGTRIKIMWDSPIHYLTCVIVPWSLVLNKPVNWNLKMINNKVQ